jgi:membrane-associated phospholipid phosphatase
MLDDDLALIHLADALGTHALPGFFVVLALLLASVTGLWKLLDRVGMPHEQGHMPQLAFLALHVGLGFLLVLSAASLFASLAEQLWDGVQMGMLDEVFSAAVRDSVSIDVLRAFASLTQLANRETLIGVGFVVAVALVATGRHGLAAGWVLALAGNGLLTRALKKVFERVRPEHDHGLLLETGFSFPSAHSSGAVVAYGMLAYLAVRLMPRRWHLPALLCGTAVAFAVGASRVFLQVHFATDVIAGFASGTVWLVVCIASIELTRFYHRIRS